MTNITRTSVPVAPTCDALIYVYLDSDTPEAEGAGGEGCTFDVDIRVAYVNLRGRVWSCAKIGGERAKRGPRRVCSELGVQSRPPDIVDGGAVRESLSIAAEKDERI